MARPGTRHTSASRSHESTRGRNATQLAQPPSSDNTLQPSVMSTNWTWPNFKLFQPVADV